MCSCSPQRERSLPSLRAKCAICALSLHITENWAE